MVAMEGSAFGIVGCQVVSKEGAEKMKVSNGHSAFGQHS
jgi:hypothetical protein